MIETALRVTTLAIQFITSLVILAAAAAALIQLVQRRILDARLTLASGVTTALSFQVSATLLTTIELRTWDDIGKFAVIFILRTLVGRLLTWERRHLGEGSA